jgi:hypothetical protein
MSRSFNCNARKVRNPRLPIGYRKSALVSCSAAVWPHVSFLKRVAWIEIRFGFTFGVESETSPTEQQMLDAVSNLEVERNLWMERLRRYERKRIREKMRGKRKPPRADIHALYDADPEADRRS